jgi:uncharacterized protein
MMFRLIFLVLFATSCVSCLAQPSSQDQPATKEDVQRYLDAIHSHDMMKQMISAMTPPLHQMIHEEFAKDKDKLPADFETRLNQMLDDMWKDMPFDEMMQAMIPSYQKHFTKGDIDGLVAFYSSPTGQKILREMPAIMSEAMQAMMPIMRKQIKGMQERIQQQMAEMLKQSKSTAGSTNPQN